jgi:TonB-linked SusC/RagA family outer membrane protein
MLPLHPRCSLQGIISMMMILLCFSFGATAQSITIQGKVTGNGTPLPGVSIRVAGTQTGATTGADGVYTLSAAPNASLVFSSYGYKTQTVAVNNRTSINVTLDVDQKSLEEVVVVGYGTQKKVNLTGAVATVDGDQLLKRPITNPSAMLQGAMPGVQIVQGTGEPGNEQVSIRIRGSGTFSGAGADPLVLIDGVEGRLSDLNPSNIENVSVLKDAASASIYGSRAANGVIIVTTKQGKEGKMKVSYDFNYGINKATRLFDQVTNSAQYMTMFNEAMTNSGLVNAGKTNIYTQDEIDAYKNATDHKLYPNTNWMDVIFQTAPTTQHNLNISGGKGGTVYDASIGYVNQEGIMRGFNYKKYTARLNVTSDVNKWLRFGANVFFKNGHREQPEDGSEDIFLSAMAQAPTYSPKLADGSGHYTYKAYDFEQNNKNPLAMIEGGINHNTDDYAATMQSWVEVKLLKHFSWYTKAAADAYVDKYINRTPALNLYNFRTNQFMTALDLGSSIESQDEITIYTNIYSYLNYDQTFGGHNIKLEAGYSKEASNYQYLKGSRRNYTLTTPGELDGANGATQYNNGTENGWALISFFGRLNYNYKERYLFEANLRYDGSSKLTPSSRWGAFPSFSAGWRVTEEQFMKDLELSWLNNLKFRGSYGKLGNQNIGNYPYQAIINPTNSYSFNNSTLTNGLAQTDLNNPDIHWELSTMSDVGLDLTIFKGLNLTADWYKKRTTDILRSAQVTGVVGLNPPTINNGTVDNTGVELGLSYSGDIKDVHYTIGGNLEHYRNQLVDYGSKDIYDHTTRQTGHEIDNYYLLKVAGIFQTDDEIAKSPKQYNDIDHPGDLKYVDANHDGVINDADKVFVSGAFPALNYSLNLQLQWKGFDLYAMAQGVNNIKYYVNGWGTLPFIQGSSPTTNWLNAWTPEHPSATMPRLYFAGTSTSNIGRASTFFLQDASYLRLKNITLGYTLPHTLTNRIGIDNVRVFFSGDNLLTATKYPGLDPERPFNQDNNFVQYPQNKVYSFGLNVKF